MPPDGHVRGGDRNGGEARLRHRAARAAPVPEGRDLPGVDRQLRADGIRHGRDLRLSGPRSARPGFRAQVWAGRGAGGAAARRGPRGVHHRQRGLCRARHDHQLRLHERPGRRGGEARGDRRTGATRRRPRRGELAAARLGREPAALLGLPDPGDPLRRLWRGAGAGRSVAGETARRCDVRPAGQSAGSPSDLEARRLSALWRRGAAGDRHVRHLRRQRLVFRALLQPGRRCAGGAGRGRSLDAGRSVYRRHRARDPAPAVFALLHPRDEAYRAPRRRGAVRRAVHPGHGDA